LASSHCILGEDSKLYSFHLNTALRYVSGGHYQQHETFGGYLSERKAELLDQGIDINIVD
jgi:hypothetical protein